MATNENLIPIPGRLHSVASDEIVSGANEIYDDKLLDNQENLNTGFTNDIDTIYNTIGDNNEKGAIMEQLNTIDGRLDTIDGEISALNSVPIEVVPLNSAGTAPNVNNPQENTLYRAYNFDHTQYSDWMYKDGSWTMITQQLEPTSQEKLVGYYTCNTEANTPGKEVTTGNSGYVLPTNGGAMKIKMTNVNTANNVTLKIGTETAKTLLYNGEAVSASNSWEEGEVISVYYDGTYYQASNSQGGGGKAEKIKYDNSQSGLAAENVQGALDVIVDDIKETNQSPAISQYYRLGYSSQTNLFAASTTRVTVLMPPECTKVDVVSVNEGYRYCIGGFNVTDPTVSPTHKNGNRVYDSEWKTEPFIYIPDSDVNYVTLWASKADPSSDITIQELMDNITFTYDTDKSKWDADIMPKVDAIRSSMLPVKKKVSLLGCSFSTFEGTMPSGYRTYYPSEDRGVTKLDEMWWKMLLNAADAELEVNASWSGAGASNFRASLGYPDFYDLTSELGNPDWIIVEMGGNDARNNIPLGNYDYVTSTSELSENEFIPAYTKGVRSLLETYPNAKIILVIIWMPEQFKAAIRNIGEHYGLLVVDVSEYHGDNIHPNKEEMKIVANKLNSALIATGINTNDSFEIAGEYVDLSQYTTQTSWYIIENIWKKSPETTVSCKLVPVNPGDRLIVKPTHVYEKGSHVCFLTTDTKKHNATPSYAGGFTNDPGWTNDTIIIEAPSDAAYLYVRYTRENVVIAPEIYIAERKSTIGTLTEIDGISDSIYSDRENHPIWFQGTLSNEHTWNNSGANALQRIISTIPSPKKLRVVIQDGYSCSIHEYSQLFDKASDITDGSSWLANSHQWFTGTLDIEPLHTSKTMVLILSKGENKNQDVTPLDGVNISISAVSPITDQVNKNTSNIDNINDILYGNSDSTEVVLEMEQGGLSAAAGAELENTKRIRSVGFICVHGQFTINVTNGVYFNVMYYKHNNTGSFVKYIGSWIQGGTMTDTWDGCIRISVKKSNEAVIVPTDTSVSIIGKTQDGIIDKVSKLTHEYSELIHKYSDSYVWSTDMIRRKVDVNRVGALQYLQAFCIYDGKYYSTNGSNIAEQDSSFAVLRDTTINLGHGNNLQLVGNGKAWSSGWNDQKMYRVDLSTLTVDETITLPTTGWTTGVVDEDNGIVYIFQRDTPTSTIDQYTFIKYDYVNEQVLSTRKVESFAALQSMDLYEGKILMLNGYGTLAGPSGMRIYNTSGDVLTTFDLEVLRSTEPEGIMFERDTHQIYVSDVDKNLYVLS